MRVKYATVELECDPETGLYTTEDGNVLDLSSKKDREELVFMVIENLDESFDDFELIELLMK